VRLKLHGLEAGARYAVTDLDSQGTREYSADELENVGLEVVLPTPTSSAVLKYERRN